MGKPKLTQEALELIQEEHYKLSIILVAITNYLIKKNLKHECDEYINDFLEEYKSSKGIN